MAIAKWNLIRPSLLDRLTDDAPRTTCESANFYNFSLSKMQALIQRDVSWLLNATQLAATVELRSYPHVAASTLNYGVRALAAVERLDANDVGQEIAYGLQLFEPRLLPESVNVTPLPDAKGNPFGFRIEAELWAQPVPLRIVMRTDLEAGCGIVSVVETTSEVD
ncbi:type VI secretion system protein ImpF [Rhizobium laguerreae]|uniref:Type VI secretion system protein ImpF n=1 Tax=Rhizobium laguerreae TaxID=1076926 RepID=A0ABR6GK57_9HYPH|nr:type VI secretion system baseplate subunit TssE [Rhizobium laguerreae]MBB3166690.1 type VI secretion system protein ImpF [Rhizobium laguerreae]